MASAQADFWSNVAERYDRVVDLQIGGTTLAGSGASNIPTEYIRAVEV